MTAETALDQAADLLERGFCKGTSARTSRGCSVHPEDPRASRWCAVGALRKTVSHPPLCPAVYHLLESYGLHYIAKENDASRTDALLMSLHLRGAAELSRRYGALVLQPMRNAFCEQCHHPGAHFVPPSLGEPGFFACMSFCDECHPQQTSNVTAQ